MLLPDGVRLEHVEIEVARTELTGTIEDLVVAPLAERMAREPAWRDATVRIAARGETGEILI